MGTKQHHPLQLVIEAAWDAGHTPRILVLGDRARGALPPDVIAAAESGQIVLDLIPTDPLVCRLKARFHMEHTDFQRDATHGGETCDIDHAPTAVRLYCTSSYDGGVWSLQVRTRMKRADGQPGAKSIAAIASLSREDMVALRDAIVTLLAEQEERRG